MIEFQKLKWPVALAYLVIVLLFFSIAMTSGQLKSSSVLNINDAILEGKYLLQRYEGSNNNTIFSPGLLVFRANNEKRGYAYLFEMIPDSPLAKLQGNRGFNIEVGPDVDTGGFSAIPLQGNLTVSGTANQEPRIDATFEWNHSEMRYALFTINFVNMASSPSTLESQVLILPKDASLVNSSGVYGIGNADTPAIV